MSVDRKVQLVRDMMVFCGFNGIGFGRRSRNIL
jgi:hypothetical protein